MEFHDFPVVHRAWELWVSFSSTPPSCVQASASAPGREEVHLRDAARDAVGAPRRAGRGGAVRPRRGEECREVGAVSILKQSAEAKP